MPKARPQLTEVRVVDFSTGAAVPKVITLPAELPEPKQKSRRAASYESVSYVPRKTKQQKAIEREKRSEQNRKNWRQYHIVELNRTKRLLFDALRLLRQNKVAMPHELAEALAHHEKWRPGRVGGRRYKKVHEFESD